jgi:hypothetical protein
MGIDKTKFGPTHYTLFGHIKYVVENHDGLLAAAKFRCNELRHPEMRSTQLPWSPECGTVLEDGSVLEDHDDWDCLDDLVTAGLVTRSKHNPLVVDLTLAGRIQYRSYMSQGLKTKKLDITGMLVKFTSDHGNQFNKNELAICLDSDSNKFLGLDGANFGNVYFESASFDVIGNDSAVVTDALAGARARYN